MRSNEIDSILGFYALIGCHCSGGLLQTLNDNHGCLSVSIPPSNKSLPFDRVLLELSWDAKRLSLGICVPASWFSIKARQTLLEDTPFHFQCAIIRQEKLYLQSKFFRSEMRQEHLYQRYMFMLDRLKVALENG